MWSVQQQDKSVSPNPMELTFDISSELAEPLSLLRERLNILENTLTSELFAALWTRVASLLNEYIFEQVISKHHFAVGTAHQFDHDVKALLLLFATYTLHPDSYFKEYVCDLLNIIRVKETILLLTLPADTLKQIRASLDSTSYDLTSHHIHKLSKKQVLNVLSKIL